MRLPCITHREKIQGEGVKRRRTRGKKKEAALYVGADIWRHVQAQKTTDLCAACTHPYAQVKMDKMSSLQQSGGDRGGPAPASQSAAPHRGGRCEYFESNALCYLSHNICITERNSEMSAFNQFK